ncbi:MAG: DUF542 domain-containing protein [Bacteroidia bacterium]|nr:DUF542 domain-containing protein [Bacteroidia bacterium]
MISDKSLSQIVIEQPAAAAVFDMFNLDYCGDGIQTIAEACKGDLAQAGLIAARVDEAVMNGAFLNMNFKVKDLSLSALCSYFVEKHHGTIRSVLPSLLVQAMKVTEKHKIRHPELMEIRDLLVNLKVELDHHMMKEEEMVYPRIKVLEEIVYDEQDGGDFNYRMLKDPIKVLLREHENSVETFRKIKVLSNNFKVPDDACDLYNLFYQNLLAFRTDLRLHVHLENKLLFPKVNALLRVFSDEVI